MTIKDRINALLEKHGLKLAAVKLMAQGELADGTKVASPADSFEVGAELFIVTDESETPAPDGSHTLADGTVITTEGGVITDIKAPEAASEEEPPAAETLSKETVKTMIDELNAVFAAEIAALNERVAELTSKAATLETEKAALSESLKTLSAQAPASVTKKPKAEKKTNELTPNLTTKERAAYFINKTRK